jgi:hypothetical protein
MMQFGKAEDQAQEGCEQIAGIPELAGGVSLLSAAEAHKWKWS